MNKKGFTLTELLVVIAIIALLSVVVIPSVITVNRNINERMLTQKIENIESSAELSGSNNDEIFNGTDEVVLYVWQLIDYNYMTTDVKKGESGCTTTEELGSQEVKGCVINPVSKKSLNMSKVILRKQNVGVVAILVIEGDPDSPEVIANNSLTDKVCEGLKDQSKFTGKYGTGSDDICECNSARDGFVDKNGETLNIDACLISGGNVNNNWLKYGSSTANWRVLGVYKLSGYSKLSVKIITSDPI